MNFLLVPQLVLTGINWYYWYQVPPRYQIRYHGKVPCFQRGTTGTAKTGGAPLWAMSTPEKGCQFRAGTHVERKHRQ